MSVSGILRVWLSVVLVVCSIYGSVCAVQDADVWIEDRLERLPTGQLGPFIHTSDGGIFAIDADASFTSDDGGNTWSEPRPLTGAAEKNIRVSNERALLRTKSGVIIAAFMNLNERKWTWQNDLHDAPGATLPTYVMRSLDDGRTWQDVQKLHDDWSGAVRDMIQTADGRVLFTAMKMQHDPGRHAVLTYSSTDDGKTWKASNLIDLGGKGHHGGVTEPTVAQLKDGRLWMLIRTNWGEFWTAYSHDGGRFWRTIQPSGIPASSAPGMLKRLASGRLLLVWNRPLPEGKHEWPLSGGDGLWSESPVSNHREELTLALSDDDGKTWSEPVVIARSKIPPNSKKSRWIAYPYVFEQQPGELWITTMQGNLRARLRERDFTAPQEATIINQLPLRITEPGLYRLAGDLQYRESRGQAISIEADNVTIDLNGHTLSGSGGPSTLARGINANNCSRITITNGSIRGFYFGVDIRDDARGADRRSRDHVVANVQLAGNWYFGVRVMGIASEIRNCEIVDTGGSTRESHTIPHAARIVGAKNRMHDCCIRNLHLKRFRDGKGEIVGVHFDDAPGAVFERNRIIEHTDSRDAPPDENDTVERRFGLWINGGPANNTTLTVRNNSFAGFTVPIVFAPGADGSAIRNTFHNAVDTPIRGNPSGGLKDNRSSELAAPAECGAVTAGRTIVAFGDSTTAPRGPLQTYSAILAENSSMSDLPFRVINAGIGGNNTNHARDRFDRDVLRHKPDVVVIQFGINDAAVDVWKTPPATESRVSLEEFESNLRYFVNTLKDAGTQVILMTPNPLRWTPKMKELYGRPPYQPDREDGCNVRLLLYADVVREISRTRSVRLVDVFKLFEAAGSGRDRSVDDLLLDGIHPNEQGHQLIAEQLLPHIQTRKDID